MQQNQKSVNDIFTHLFSKSVTDSLTTSILKLGSKENNLSIKYVIFNSNTREAFINLCVKDHPNRFKVSFSSNNDSEINITFRAPPEGEILYRPELRDEILDIIKYHLTGFYLKSSGTDVNETTVTYTAVRLTPTCNSRHLNKLFFDIEPCQRSLKADYGALSIIDDHAIIYREETLEIEYVAKISALHDSSGEEKGLVFSTVENIGSGRIDINVVGFIAEVIARGFYEDMSTALEAIDYASGEAYLPLPSVSVGLYRGEVKWVDTNTFEIDTEELAEFLGVPLGTYATPHCKRTDPIFLSAIAEAEFNGMESAWEIVTVTKGLLDFEVIVAKDPKSNKSFECIVPAKKVIDLG